MNWMNILKLDQINIGSTPLDTRELPEEELTEDRDCCEEAKRLYKILVGKAIIQNSDNPDIKLMDSESPQDCITVYDDRAAQRPNNSPTDLPCDRFHNYLERHWGITWAEETLEFWEACVFSKMLEGR
tara:strand:- start:342 stop:725 length:384 start_codon:yes stop_codon:yes gene_type:complete